jgi:SAM-dependent methyltransferase
MNNFYVDNWLEQDRQCQSGFLKRALYFAIRPCLSLYASRYLSKEELKKFQPSLVLPSRGMPFETRRLWGSKLCDIKESILLVQGTGNGSDVLSWARLKPKKIIATDLFDFNESWEQVTRFCHDNFDVNVEFRQAKLEDHFFLENNSINLCASDAVFEHCVDLESVLKESFRILKPKGTLYAAYNPLYFCAGGDHFSGRGGLKNSFNHLLLNSEDYKTYFQDFLKEDENFQSGGRYVEMDLFSRLKTEEYLNLSKKAGFIINNLILEISSTALKFRNFFPLEYHNILNKHTNLEECDLLISSNLIRLIKPSIN